jgi:hypothetical protein
VAFFINYLIKNHRSARYGWRRTMTTTLIRFAINQAAAIRSGYNVPVPPTIEMEVDAETLSQEQREAISSRRNSDGDIVSLDEEGLSSNGQYRQTGIVDRLEGRIPRLVLAEAPTISAVCDAIASEDEAIRSLPARKAEKKEKERLANIEVVKYEIENPRRHSDSVVYVSLNDDWSCSVSDYTPRGNIAVTSRSYSSQYVMDHYRCDVEELNESLKQTRERLRADNALRRQRAIDDAKAELQAVIQERLDWIAAHGSQRLVRMVAEGIQCEKTYQSERSKYESGAFAAQLVEGRPGWRLVEESELDRDVHDVSMRAFTILDAARRISPTSKLAKLKASGKYVAVDHFHGRLICWPQD